MKKNKKEYSLTANQRKQKRTNIAKPVEAELTQEELAAIEEKQKAQKEKNKRFIRIVAIIVVTVLALGSITTGTVLLIKANAIDNMRTNPKATITIDNAGVEQKLEMDLFYSQAPAAVSNFIYLASNGFYDNTIFNATSSNQKFLAMSGYTAQYAHKARDAAFVDSMSGFKERVGSAYSRAQYRLAYRLNKVNNDPGELYRKGYLAFLGGKESNYNSTYATSTTFMLMGSETPSLYGGGAPIADYLTYVGKLTDESIEIIDSIIAITDTIDDSARSYTGWSFADPDKHLITIKSISFDKKTLNKKLKNKIVNDFESFVLTEENLAAWHSGNKNDGYYYGA